MSNIWPFKPLKIRGHSMQPVIRDGELCLVNRWAYLFKKPQIGDIVVFDSSGKLFCKRIAAIERDLFTMLGDNRADSLDSSALGPISAKSIIGRVVA